MCVCGEEIEQHTGKYLVCPDGIHEFERRTERTIRLADIPATSFVKRIATAMVARHGTYTYTDEPTGDKVTVTR